MEEPKPATPWTPTYTYVKIVQTRDGLKTITLESHSPLNLTGYVLVEAKS